MGQRQKRSVDAEMSIKLKAIRKFESNKDYAVYDIKGFKTPVRIKIHKETAENVLDTEQRLKNYLLGEVQLQMKMEVDKCE